MSRGWCQLLLRRCADERGQSLIDTETLVVEIVQDVGALRTSYGLSGAFEGCVGVVEKSPEAGRPLVGGGFERGDLSRGGQAVEMGLCKIVERCLLLGGSNGCSPRCSETLHGSARCGLHTSGQPRCPSSQLHGGSATEVRVLSCAVRLVSDEHRAPPAATDEWHTRLAVRTTIADEQFFAAFANRGVPIGSLCASVRTARIGSIGSEAQSVEEEQR